MTKKYLIDESVLKQTVDALYLGMGKLKNDDFAAYQSLYKALQDLHTATTSPDLVTHEVCSECETVAHCRAHGCIPKQATPVQPATCWVCSGAGVEFDDTNKTTPCSNCSDAATTTPPAAPARIGIIGHIDNGKATLTASILSAMQATSPQQSSFVQKPDHLREFKKDMLRREQSDEMWMFTADRGWKEDEVRVLYTTPPAQPAPVTWLPIETAPKIGEERLKFKALLRSYATKMAAKNLSMKQTDDTTQSHVPKISQSTFNTNTVADPLLPKDVAIIMEAAMNARACGLIAGTSNWAAFMSKFLTGDHEDDTAVYRFALAMKEKMEQARAKGRDGWNDPVDCSTERLQEMLLNHIEKGDPVDVANFCMMLWTRGAPTKDSSKENLTSRPAWEHHAEKFVQWKHRLSYNDSYVGEPVGLFKEVALALDRLIGQDVEKTRTEALNILTWTFPKAR